MAPTSIVAVGLAGAFGVLAALHVAWAVAGPTNVPVVPTRAGGAPVFRPGRAATLAVALALLAAAAVVLGRAGLPPAFAPAVLYRAGAWGVAGVLLLRTAGDFRYVGLFKRERGTRFALLDTRLYTPACAALAAAALYLAAA